MSLRFYEYTKCSTCRKAKSWLEKHNIAVESIPIVEEPPSLNDLKQFISKSGLEIRKFFNTSGQAYRELQLSRKLPNMSEAEMLKLLAGNGKLIKRPLLVTPSKVLVGFQEENYKKNLT